MWTQREPNELTFLLPRNIRGKFPKQMAHELAFGTGLKTERRWTLARWQGGTTKAGKWKAVQEMVCAWLLGRLCTAQTNGGVCGEESMTVTVSPRLHTNLQKEIKRNLSFHTCANMHSC